VSSVTNRGNDTGGGSEDRGHSHDHDGDGHHHGPGHVHAPESFGKAFAIGISLNAALVLAQGVYGYTANSTALMADAGHNLSDVLGLVVAWAASVASKRPPSGRFTYGLKGTSILAALANAVFLLVATGAIGWESVQRFWQPEPVAGVTVMVVAAIGIVINGATALLFAKGRESDLNIQGAFLHMAGDAAVSEGVVVSAALILWTGWLWLDPAMSLLICAVVLWSTWGLLRGSIGMSLSAAPTGGRGCGEILSARSARRDRRTRPARLADQHDRDRHDVSRRHARGAPGRQLPDRVRSASPGALSDRAFHAADRDHREQRLRSGLTASSE
jgi:cobalt-zinc-cadmium efflux system protein